MTLPGFGAEASAYVTNNAYRQTAGAGHAANGALEVVPQDCGFVEGLVCAPVIAGGIAICTASCLASAELGGIPCYLCWAAFAGSLYGFCRDCIPAWIRAIIDGVEGGGGGGGGGGGVPLCCPPGKSCRCGGRCVTQADGSIRCVGGLCLSPHQVCP